MSDKRLAFHHPIFDPSKDLANRMHWLLAPDTADAVVAGLCPNCGKPARLWAHWSGVDMDYWCPPGWRPAARPLVD
jgi:hypothetical protein